MEKFFPRTLSAHLADLPKGKPVEVWFQDEARIGQKNGVCSNGGAVARGPGSPAICPARDKRAAMTLPFADTAAMQLHLDEISPPCGARRARRAATRPDLLAHDRQAEGAERHHAGAAAIASPGTQPGRNVWQNPRANWLPNRVFDGQEARRLLGFSSPKPKQSHPSECESGLTSVELHDLW